MEGNEVEVSFDHDPSHLSSVHLPMDIDHFNYGRQIAEHISPQVQEGARPVHLHSQRRLRQIRFDLTTTRELASVNEYKSSMPQSIICNSD